MTSSGFMNATVISCFFKRGINIWDRHSTFFVNIVPREWQSNLLFWEFNFYRWQLEITVHFAELHANYYFSQNERHHHISYSVVIQVIYCRFWMTKQNTKDQVKRGCLVFHNTHNILANQRRKYGILKSIWYWLRYSE